MVGCGPSPKVIRKFGSQNERHGICFGDDCKKLAKWSALPRNPRYLSQVHSGPKDASPPMGRCVSASQTSFKSLLYAGEIDAFALSERRADSRLCFFCVGVLLQYHDTILV